MSKITYDQMDSELKSRLEIHGINAEFSDSIQEEGTLPHGVVTQHLFFLTLFSIQIETKTLNFKLLLVFLFIILILIQLNSLLIMDLTSEFSDQISLYFIPKYIFLRRKKDSHYL
jgi:hypothetical protein